MRDSCENIASKLKEIEDEQEIENKVNILRVVSPAQYSDNLMSGPVGGPGQDRGDVRQAPRDQTGDWSPLSG